MAQQKLPVYTQIGIQYPLVLRDFRQGRYTPYSVSPYISPTNSISFCRNVNFDTTLGSAVVRKGTTLIGTAVAANETPLGFSEFVGTGGTPNYLMAVFSGTSNATAYYWSGSAWTATNKTALSNTKLNRFSTLGGSIFMTNGTDGMLDSPQGTTFGTTNSISTVLPSLIHRYNATMLCSGDATYPSRVWFSSVISPGSSPFITWNNDVNTGNWIDINPDDGCQVTAFAETSTYLLVFKNHAMYRLNTVNKSTQAQNIYNVGAVSQEAVTTCQGVAYFFSGRGIYSTDGSLPVQQGRGQVQDIIDNIPQANWAAVAAGHDEFNVYFAVGTVTVNANTDNAVTYKNCVLKYSTRDSSWSVHTYANAFKFFAEYTDSTNGRMMRGSTTAGDVQTVNLGTLDNTTAINYELMTQDIDFGNRSHTKQMSDTLVIFTQNGQDSSIECLCDGQRKNIPTTLTNRVNYARDINLTGHFFNFHWYGESTGTPPVFEGVTVESVQDLGLVNV